MYIQPTKTNRFVGKITMAQDKKACCFEEDCVLKGSYDKVIDSAHLRNQRTN